MIYFDLKKILSNKKVDSYNMIIYELDEDGNFGYLLNTTKAKYISDDVMVKVDLYRSANNGAVVYTIFSRCKPIYLSVLNTDKDYVLMLEDMPASAVCEVYYDFYKRSK